MDTAAGRIDRQLRRLRTRVRWLTAGFGLGRVLAALAGLTAAVVTADYLLNLPAWPRVVAIAAAVVAIGAVAWRALARPLASRLSLSDVAGRVEERFPEFEDRLRSAVAFESAVPEGTIESEDLRRRTREQAAELAARLDLNKAVDPTPARRNLAGGVVAVLGLALVGGLVPPDYRSAAVSRIASPFAGAAWPKRTQISVLGETPTRVAAGSRVPIRLKLTRGDRPSSAVTVSYQYDNGPVATEQLRREADGSFVTTLDARPPVGAASTLTVTLRSGDDEVRLPPLTVVPRLTVTRVTARVTPPEYVPPRPGGAGEIDLTAGATAGPLTVVEGSTVRLDLGFNKPLAAAPTLVAGSGGSSGAGGGEVPAATGVSFDGARAELTISPEGKSRFAVNARDTDGFEATSLTEYEVLVRPDQQPMIQLELPRRSEERTARAFVPMQAVAEDDFAVREVVLVVSRSRDKRQWTLPLVRDSKATAGAEWTDLAAGAPDRSRMRLRYLWELASLDNADLKPGDRLEYFLAARDTYRRRLPDGTVVEHPPATSSRFTITIVSDDDLAARVAEEMRNVGEQVGRLRDAQRRTADETTELSDASRKSAELDDARKQQARRLADQQSVLAGQGKQLGQKLSELMERLAENRLPGRELPETAKDTRELLDRAAEGPMSESSAKLSDARQQPQDAREKTLDQARESQRQADQLLSKAVDRLGSLGSVRQTMESLRNLLDQQKQVGEQTREVGRANVGKKPQEMSAADRKKLEDLARQQAELAERTEKLLQDMQRQAKELERSDPQASQAMKQASDTGQQQQTPGAQRNASRSMQQNQQGQAQSEQRRAELGLQLMLETLRDAEKRKLEELSRRLAQLSEQLAILVRRQAGHNLDNLGLRPPAWRAVPQADKDALLAKAERKPDAAFAPGLAVGGLSAGQEQTERNTRGLSESAAVTPGTSEVAGVLARAAGRMERAAVLLRGNDIAGAYEPPQLEALAALESAAKQVADLNEQAKKDLERQQKETIRAQYQALRDEQDALLKETQRLQAIRARGLDLPRPDAVKLGQLPPQQQALADRAAAIEEALAELESVVYLWANKDIVATMKEVRAMLEQRRTDAPVQGEQRRVIRQLDAMIASLTIKPKEEEFEQRQAGGGGGGQGGQQRQRLPSEAELTLLKRLQQAVNDGTKEQQDARDEPSLDGLARRQGDLRKLLGDLLGKASGGGFELGDEPKREVKLPEETAGGGGADDDLERELLEGKAHGEDADPKAASVVDRMARSRQRLADDNDPGPVTQKIQARILEDLDNLIEEARNQQQARRSSQGQAQAQGQGGQAGQPQPGQGAQPGNQGRQGGQGGGQANANGPSAQGSNTEAPSGPDARKPELTGGDLAERMSEWGGITPRQRQAVIDAAGETVVEKYRQLIDDYYRALAEKNAGGNPPR